MTYFLYHSHTNQLANKKKTTRHHDLETKSLFHIMYKAIP